VPGLHSPAVLLVCVSKASACWGGFSEQQHGRLPEGASSNYIQNFNHNCPIHDPNKYIHTAYIVLSSSLFIYLWHQREFQKWKRFTEITTDIKIQ